MLAGIPQASICFVIGLFPHIHWSTYLASRTFFLGLFSLIYLCATYGWQPKEVDFATDMRMPSFKIDGDSNSDDIIHGLQPVWISMIAAFMVGPIACTFRVTSVFGCQELEEYTEGSAGIIGNLINTAYIPISALYAYVFFDELLMPLDYFGALLIGFAILVIAGVKMIKLFGTKHAAEEGDGEPGEKGRVKDCDSLEDQEEKVSLLH